MKCPQCGTQTEIKDCLHYPWGCHDPIVVYSGPWCWQCKTYVGISRCLVGDNTVTRWTEVEKLTEK